MSDDPRKTQDDDPREPPAEEGTRARQGDGGPQRDVPKPGGSDDDRTG